MLKHLFLARLSFRLIGDLIVRPSSIRRPHSSNIFSSETTGPSKARFHIEPQKVRGMEVYSPHLGHMTKMAAMPIYGKKPLKIFFSGTKGPMVLGLNMQHLGHGPNKICWPYLGQMTKMAATPIYGKNPLKSSSPEPKGPMALELGMQYWGHGPNDV